MTLWWDRFPGLLDDELRALSDAGIKYEKDDAAWNEGVLRLALRYPYKGRSIALVATYPDLYPYFKPEVTSDELTLSRHQNPIARNLCLVGRRTSRWFAEDTLAKILQERMPHLLDFADTGDLDAILKVEEPQGEPASDYYNGASLPGSMIVFDGSWTPPTDIRRGRFRAFVDEVGTVQGIKVFRGYVSEILDEDQNVIATWTSGHPDCAEQFEGPWLRLDQPVLGNIETVVTALDDADRKYLLDQQRWPKKRATILSALVFPEEIRQQEFADGWTFIQLSLNKYKRNTPRQYSQNFVRTVRGAADDQAARMPAVRALAEKTVAVVGLGAIGAPIAIELARSGIDKLILVDFDIVEPATIRRWSLGWAAVGRRKEEVLQEHLGVHYPDTIIEAVSAQLGSAFRLENTPPQIDIVQDIIQQADVIVDASAELGVNHVLSDFTAKIGKPYVVANATPGAWGGMVAQFLPDKDQACWYCLREALYGEEASIELPPADPHGDVQPPGCGDITFTGTSYDLREISMETVRIVAGILAGDYPETTWDLGILSLRDADGRRIPPHWKPHIIPRHAGCACQREAS